MANTKTDSRQIEHRTSTPRLSDQAKPTLRTIIPQIDSELTPVFELRESSTPDLVLNVGSGTVVNSDTGLTRSFSPIDQQLFTFTGGTVTFPATTGGTITVSPGINSTLVMANDTYMAVLIQINSVGELSVALGTAVGLEADVLASGNAPVPNDGDLPIGYVVLRNIAGAVQNITNEKIVQFESGGGAGGSGDAVGFESEMDLRLYDSYFEYYTAIIFKRDKETLLDGASTGSFVAADGTFTLQNTETFISSNLFDSEFVAQSIKSLQKELVVDYFDDASRDDGATYEISIDGGVTYEAITLTRQEGTTRYIGRLRLSDNATFNDLRVRVTASEADTKIQNIAIFYNEIFQNGITGKKQQQTFAVNGNDNQTDFVLTNFLPDSNLTKMYVEETGQVFYRSSLTFSGFTVSVPSGTFDAPGDTFTVTIEQLEGESFDNSDENAALMAANGLGSMDNSIDRSQAGVGIIQRDEVTNKRNQFVLRDGILYIEELE